MIAIFLFSLSYIIAVPESKLFLALKTLLSPKNLSPTWSMKRATNLVKAKFCEFLILGR
jgi:hypothetical protein